MTNAEQAEFAKAVISELLPEPDYSVSIEDIRFGSLQIKVIRLDGGASQMFDANLVQRRYEFAESFYKQEGQAKKMADESMKAEFRLYGLLDS